MNLRFTKKKTTVSIVAIIVFSLLGVMYLINYSFNADLSLLISCFLGFGLPIGIVTYVIWSLSQSGYKKFYTQPIKGKNRRNKIKRRK
jgi:hypothetical protein